MSRIYIIALLCLCLSPCFGQVTVQFVPEVYGRNIDGLLNCSVINTTRKLTASLKVTVSERKAGTVCIVKTADFDILPGSNPLPVTAVRTSAIQFGSNKLSQITRQSHLFPEGDYDYCYELTFRNTDNPPLEQCFSYTLEPFTELSLIDPYNKDKVCDHRPMFTWQPLLPGIPGSYYQLTLAEIKLGQNSTEALNYNLPVINQRGIMSPVLPYPSITPELEKGKKYAWQVTAYKDQTILNRSEVWEFTIDCQDSVAKVVNVNGYRDIEDLAQGNSYVATGTIRFAFVNSYGPQKLDYEILALDRQDKPIKHLPKIQLVTGRNQIDIDLSSTSGIKAGDFYIMNVKLPGGVLKSLRFVYKEPLQ